MYVELMSKNIFRVTYVMGGETYVFRGRSVNDLFDAVEGVSRNPNYDFGRDEAVSVSAGIMWYIASGDFIKGMFDADFVDGNFGEDSAEDSRGVD